MFSLKKSITVAESKVILCPSKTVLVCIFTYNHSSAALYYCNFPHPVVGKYLTF
jgi:hypothetical protein